MTDTIKGMTATMMVEYVQAIVNHVEQSPGGQSLDDASKASILKAAAGIYEHKIEREAMLAVIMRELSK